MTGHPIQNSRRTSKEFGRSAFSSRRGWGLLINYQSPRPAPTRDRWLRADLWERRFRTSHGPFECWLNVERQACALRGRDLLGDLARPMHERVKQQERAEAVKQRVRCE